MVDLRVDDFSIPHMQIRRKVLGSRILENHGSKTHAIESQSISKVQYKSNSKFYQCPNALESLATHYKGIQNTIEEQQINY